MFKFIQAYRENRAFERLTRRGIFYYRVGKTTVKIDPLVAYIRLKEVGLDVASDDLRGALRGDAAKLKEFVKTVRKAFDVPEFDYKSEKGFADLECVRLYFAYHRYLAALKKNAPILRDFAPRLEERLLELFAPPTDDSASETTSSSSPSISSPQAPSPSPDSPSTTEPAEPSEVSPSTSLKPTGDETTSL